MNLLEKARLDINEIDKEIANLFEKRMKAVEQVAKYKITQQLPILDSGREYTVIQKNLNYIQDEMIKPHFEEVLKTMMKVSRDYQKHKIGKSTIVYPGVEGSFSHIAAQSVFPQETLQRVNTFQEVFEAVASNEVCFGIVPFENSYTGEVGEVLDHLLHYDVYIQDVYDLLVQQNLLGLPDATMDSIKQVYSHPQAISQSKTFLDMHSWEIIPYTNTAMAAQYVSQTKDCTKAAIASYETAKLYGLKILKEHINTSDENTTRFIVISKHMRENGNRFHILFTLQHNAGQLAKVMQIIAERGFNMENIKSRPLHNQPWQYYFYVEIDGDIAHDETKVLLKDLKESCDKIKLLGAFHVKEG